MVLLPFVLFVLLIVGPVVLAWFKGDAILSYFARRRQQHHRRRRQRTTRALPIREVALDALLSAEARREAIEDRIGDALGAFRQVTQNGRALTTQQSAVMALDDLEQAVLARESAFGDYIDIAWLQSETLESMNRQVELLREVALDNRTDTAQTQASAHLLQVLKEATGRRAQIDQALNRIGPARIRQSGRADV